MGRIAREAAVSRPLVIVELFPGLLFNQGDGGNVLAMAWRARQRGIAVEVRSVGLGEPVPPANLYVIGGAEDEDQAVVAQRLRIDGTVGRAAADGAVVFGVGAGYQILGRSFPGPESRPVEGLGLLDAMTSLAAFVDRRVVTRPRGDLGLPAMSGYETHRGRTVLGRSAQPLAELEIGTGNGGTPPTDGAIQGHVVGTYLHGPVLPRNPELADVLLAWSLGRRPAELEPLGDRESRFAALVNRERIAEARRYAKELR
jgi:lipid II isoglutaminyl synthase (glutamine-hydrolysing)